MTCPTCHASLAESALGCAACLTSKAFHELLGRQKEFLPQVLARTMTLRCAKVAKVRHIMLFTSSEYAYCGERIKRADFFRLYLEEVPPDTTCRDCLKALDKAFAEAS